MKRRLIASLLAVCLVAGLLPTVALAAEGKPGEENAPGCAELEGCVGEAMWCMACTRTGRYAQSKGR